MVDDAEPTVTDGMLLSRALGGDGPAFDTLFARHLSVLEARARRLLPPSVRRRVSISDVVQEARIVALQRAVDFEARGEEASCRPWLLQIVEYKAREALRAHAGTAKRDVRREVPPGLRPDTPQLPGRSPSPSRQALASEARATVLQALAALPDDYREVLQRTRLEHWTLAEVAAATGRSREAVKKLYARALARFTDVLRAAREAPRE